MSLSTKLKSNLPLRKIGGNSSRRNEPKIDFFSLLKHNQRQ